MTSSTPADLLAAAEARQAEIVGKPPRLDTLDRHAEAEMIVEVTHRLRTAMFGADVKRLAIDEVPEIMVTMAPFSALWERIMGLSMEVMGPGARLSKRDQKLAILRTGWLLQAPYEFGEHAKQALGLGFTQQEIDRIAFQGSAAPEWNEHERAVLRAAEELRGNVYVSDETWATLATTLDNAQLFELVILIGQFTLVAYFQNTLRLPLEPGNAGLLGAQAGLAAGLGEGRQGSQRNGLAQSACGSGGSNAAMLEIIEKRLTLDRVSVMTATSQWEYAENWSCPETSYVVCQRLSDGHSPLRVEAGGDAVHEVYLHVHALGFMPSAGSIRMYPLERPLRTLNCFFDKDYFEAETELDGSVWLSRAGPFMPFSSRLVETMMRQIHGELLEPGFGTEGMIEAAATMIAIEMARFGRQNFTFVARAGQPAPRLALWQLRRIRERLEAAPQAGYPQLQELAGLCGISRGHLIRTFKATTGQSLHVHIAGERLKAAQRLLGEDRHNIKEIAALLDFSSSGHFTNAFRRMTGATPSHYRKIARAERAESVDRLPDASN